ncbi:MAG: hypothetical protein P9M13_04620 [Candidatus Ancaeobacter aquaticus]|nr:hypothetical protein [Candidatus Ancaeobacter aquaticus]
MKKCALLVMVMVCAVLFGLSVPAYAVIDSNEMGVLQKLCGQLEASAQQEVSKVESLSHAGRYNEDILKTQLISFRDASQKLNAEVTEGTPTAKNLSPVMNELKTLVLNIDDVFVYDAGYDHVRRDWNECKRILRRINGLVYREGVLRRLQNIIDSNEFFKDVGYFFKVHGALGKLEDTLHGDKMFKPINDIVGRHGGGRDTTRVLIVPEPKLNAQSTQNRSSFNEDLNGF